MNYAMPTYECKKEDTTGRGHFSCSVEIGGIRYIGAVARTKKEAEIKAARTALLAIQTSSSEMVDNLNEGTNFTVVPPKRKEPPPPKKAAVKTRKTKSYRFKKKFGNKKRKIDEDNATTQANNVSESNCQLSSSTDEIPKTSQSQSPAIKNPSHGDTLPQEAC
ncbi:hypothetical protein V2J09_017252 [Rumex salicifolius]